MKIASRGLSRFRTAFSNFSSSWSSNARCGGFVSFPRDATAARPAGLARASLRLNSGAGIAESGKDLGQVSITICGAYLGLDFQRFAALSPDQHFLDGGQVAPLGFPQQSQDNQVSSSRAAPFF